MNRKELVARFAKMGILKDDPRFEPVYEKLETMPDQITVRQLCLAFNG